MPFPGFVGCSCGRAEDPRIIKLIFLPGFVGCGCRRTEDPRILKLIFLNGFVGCGCWRAENPRILKLIFLPLIHVVLLELTRKTSKTSSSTSRECQWNRFRLKVWLLGQSCLSQIGSFLSFWSRPNDRLLSCQWTPCFISTPLELIHPSRGSLGHFRRGTEPETTDHESIYSDRPEGKEVGGRV